MTHIRAVFHINHIAVVELPSSTSQEAEHVQLILDTFSGIQSILGFQVVGSHTVYSSKPVSESVTMQQLRTYTQVGMIGVQYMGFISCHYIYTSDLKGVQSTGPRFVVISLLILSKCLHCFFTDLTSTTKCYPDGRVLHLLECPCL